jgi:hypothetical protein
MFDYDLSNRKVKKLKRLKGRSVVHGQHSGPEVFRYIFFGDWHHRDRRKQAVMDWARILAHVTATVDQDTLRIAWRRGQHQSVHLPLSRMGVCDRRPARGRAHVSTAISIAANGR